MSAGVKTLRRVSETSFFYSLLTTLWYKTNKQNKNNDEKYNIWNI